MISSQVDSSRPHDLGSSSEVGFVSLSHEIQAFNTMMICDKILFPHNLMVQMWRANGMKNRACAVEWMMKVMADESADIRDTSIRIFDTYLTVSYSENPRVLDDTCYIAFAAAAAIVVSSKLHNTRNTVDPSWFTAFNTEDILFFERQILLKIGSRISPLATPAFFLQFATPLCLESCRNEEELREVAAIANVLIGEFWEDPSCLLFAPSTIAITAMIVSLSLHHITCQKFLNKLPDFFFPDRDNFPCFQKGEENKESYLDFHQCMLSIETLPTFRAMNRRYGSPTSIVAMHGMEDQLVATQVPVVNAANREKDGYSAIFSEYKTATMACASGVRSNNNNNNNTTSDKQRNRRFLHSVDEGELVAADVMNAINAANEDSRDQHQSAFIANSRTITAITGMKRIRFEEE